MMCSRPISVSPDTRQCRDLGAVKLYCGMMPGRKPDQRCAGIRNGFSQIGLVRHNRVPSDSSTLDRTAPPRGPGEGGAVDRMACQATVLRNERPAGFWVHPAPAMQPQPLLAPWIHAS
jgi:hypothetical protein